MMFPLPIAICVSILFHATIVFSDEETSSLAKAAFLASSVSGSGSGGSSSGSSAWEQIFGADVGFFGGQNGNPFRDSFLAAAMADMNLDTLALYALVDSMDSQGAAASSSGSSTSVSSSSSGSASASNTASNFIDTGSLATSGFNNEGWHRFGGFRGSGGMGWEAGSSAGGGLGWRGQTGGGIGFGGRAGGGFGIGGHASGSNAASSNFGSGAGWMQSSNMMTDMLGQSQFGKPSVFPQSNFGGSNSMSNSGLTSALLQSLVHGVLSRNRDSSFNQQSTNTNINVNNLLSALMSSRRDTVDLQNFIYDTKMRDRLTNEQNIARILSYIQNLQTREKTSPVVVVGLDRSGKALSSGTEQGNINLINSLIQRQRHLDLSGNFSPIHGRNHAVKPLPARRTPPKDINLNILVRQDRPMQKLSGPDKWVDAQSSGTLSTGINSIARSDFNNINVLEGLNQMSLNKKEPATFSFKPFNGGSLDTPRGSVDMQSFWKETPNPAQIKAIPNGIVEQRLAQFMKDTNRGDLWQRLSGNHGTAVSDGPVKPGFVTNDNFFNALSPGTQLEHSQRLIAYPKSRDHISQPIFKDPVSNKVVG